MTTLIQQLWRGNRPMTAVGLAMLPLLVLSVAGIFADPRIITGVPAWLKPAKFAISIAIYLLTLAWVYQYLTVWPQVLNAAAWVAAVAMALEIVIIDLQAFRGTTSHFNFATPLDSVLFGIMGAAIAALLISAVVIAAALFRQSFDNPVLGTALRLGMLMTVIGASTGNMMIQPRPEQLAQARETHHLTRVGSHTVGAPDGGPGLPVTGWSRQHGDLRVSHFLGLHALQFMIFLAVLLLHWGVPEARAVRIAGLAAVSYFALFALLLVQALRGESIITPSYATLVGMGAWMALTLLGGFLL